MDIMRTSDTRGHNRNWTSGHGSLLIFFQFNIFVLIFLKRFISGKEILYKLMGNDLIFNSKCGHQKLCKLSWCLCKSSLFLFWYVNIICTGRHELMMMDKLPIPMMKICNLKSFFLFWDVFFYQNEEIYLIFS